MATMGKLKRIANLAKARYIFYCLLSFVLFGCFSPPKPLADESLIETFKNQQSEFETLTNMLLDDTELQKVTAHYIHPENAKISSKRLREYRQLLKDLDLRSIERDRVAVFLTIYVNGGFPDDGVYKGYVYFPNGIPRELEASVVSNLDGLEWNPNSVTELYRKIDEKWYLWFVA